MKFSIIKPCKIIEFNWTMSHYAPYKFLLGKSVYNCTNEFLLHLFDIDLRDKIAKINMQRLKDMYKDTPEQIKVMSLLKIYTEKYNIVQ